MVASLLGIILIAPLVAVIGCLLIHHPRFVELLNLAAAIIVFLAVLCLLPRALSGPYLFWAGYLIVDPLSAWVSLSVASVYLLASIYAVGYMRSGDEKPCTASMHFLPDLDSPRSPVP